MKDDAPPKEKKNQVMFINKRELFSGLEEIEWVIFMFHKKNPNLAISAVMPKQFQELLYNFLRIQESQRELSHQQERTLCIKQNFH